MERSFWCLLLSRVSGSRAGRAALRTLVILWAAVARLGRRARTAADRGRNEGRGNQAAEHSTNRGHDFLRVMGSFGVEHTASVEAKQSPGVLFEDTVVEFLGDRSADEVAVCSHRRQRPIGAVQEAIGALRVADGAANLLREFRRRLTPRLRGEGTFVSDDQAGQVGPDV